MGRHYHSIADALGAMSLDYGSNPFAVGQAVVGDDGRRYTRPTKAALASLGYVVDPTEADKDDDRRREASESHDRRQAEANAAYDARRRAEEAAKAERVTVNHTVEEVFAAAGRAPEQCSMAQYGDDSGRNTVIVTCADKRLVAEREGAAVVSVKVVPVMLGATECVYFDADGKQQPRQGGGLPWGWKAGYLLRGRLGDRTFWRAVPQRGEESEHATRKEALAALAAMVK